jgi:biotin carboxylase
MRNKIVMRRAFAEEGVPQPPFAALRSLGEARRALETVGLPAVLKPADSGGQRGIFRIESIDDLERHLHAALAESAEQECILEGFVDGTEMNGIVIARGGTAEVVTLSDRLRPPGIGFGVGWMHVYPASTYGDQLELSERVASRAVEVLGLRDGIAFPQLIVSDDGSVRVVEVAARIPGGQMADLVRHAVGVDLVEVALRQALGEEIPDELVLPHFKQPLAIRFLTAQPGPLPTGKVLAVGSLDPVLAAPGVVQADTYLQVGETIRPVRLDGDRRGYVIATADTSVEALQRAEDAARLLEVVVEWTRTQLEATWSEHLEAPFPEATDDALVDLAEYDGYVAGLVQTVLDRPGHPLEVPLNVNGDLTGRIRSTGNEEAIAYVDRLNKLVEIARGVLEAEVEPR